MIESIHLKNAGPAYEMQMALAPRLNLITGDNGLGESEQAIEAAQAVLEAPDASAMDIAEADQGLRKAALPELDPF